MMLEWLERVSALFYDPWVFWGLPLLLALLIEGIRKRRTGRRRGPRRPSWH